MKINNDFKKIKMLLVKTFFILLLISLLGFGTYQTMTTMNTWDDREGLGECVETYTSESYVHIQFIETLLWFSALIASCAWLILMWYEA